MAFSPKEQEIIRYGVLNGKNSQEIQQAVLRSRLNIPLPKPQTPATDTYGQRLGDAFTAGVDKVGEGVGQVVNASNPLQAAQGALKAGAGVVDAVSSPVTAAVQPIVQPIVQPVVQGAADALANTKPIQKLASSTQEGGVVDQALGAAADAGTIAGGILGASGTAATARAATQVPKVALSYFKNATTLDDLVTQADVVKNVFKKVDTGSDVTTPYTDKLAAAESAAPKLTAKEQLAGVRPDIKARIAGKLPKLKEYFEVAQTRNLTDQAPNPFEYGAQHVQVAQNKLEGILNDTGSQIGAFRKKVGSYKATPDEVATVEQEFAAQLDKLNLSVTDGAVAKIPGKIAQTVSDGEIKALNELYGDIRTYMQSPTLENAIALRNKFRNRINFDKASSEVSGTVDPLSRAVQARLKEVAARQVGPTEAKNLEAYADISRALDELRSFTDRRAGSEFLIKQVLSERGGEARAVIDTIRQHTGIDLMDDAVMARLATDIVGNDAQKGMFRQEITRAGLDAKALLTGDAKGLVSAIYQRGMDYLIDPKQIYLEAAADGKRLGLP